MTMRFRKKKLINTGLQLKLIAVFLFLSCISALFQVILLNRSVMSLSSLMETDGDILLAELPGLLFSNMIMTLGVLLPMMLLVGILVTHRVAGPIYRFEQHLGAIARGEDPGICRIRKGDELQELCTILNDAVATLKANGESKAEAIETTSVVDVSDDDETRQAA